MSSGKRYKKPGRQPALSADAVDNRGHGSSPHLIESRLCRCRPLAGSGVLPGLPSNSVTSKSFSDSRRARKLEASLADGVLAGLGGVGAGAAVFLRVEAVDDNVNSSAQSHELGL